MATLQSGGKAGGSNGGAARLALLAVAGLVAAILGLSLSVLMFGEGEAPQRGGPFSLVNHRGAPTDEAILKGRLSILYFGYTHCPDICPPDFANVVELRDQVKEQGGQAQAVFISVDPERDTPEALDAYVGAFGDDLIGLTGTAEQVAAAAKAYGALYAKSPPADPDDPMSYELLHSTYFYAVGPDAKVLWRFPSKTPPDVALRRLRELGAL